VRIVDLGSKHGAFVQGCRVERGFLAVGDLVEAGGVGFLVTQAPRTFVPEPHPRLV